jgi:hypothetical protein
MDADDPPADESAAKAMIRTDPIAIATAVTSTDSNSRRSSRSFCTRIPTALGRLPVHGWHRTGAKTEHPAQIASHLAAATAIHRPGRIPALNVNAPTPDRDDPDTSATTIQWQRKR